MYNPETQNQAEQIAPPRTPEAVLETDRLSPENDWEDIKSEAGHQGETAVSETEKNIKENFTAVSSAIDSEPSLAAEAETIKQETQEKISARQNLFQEQITALGEENKTEAAPEKTENKAEAGPEKTEMILGEVKSSFVRVKALEKQIKESRDEGKKAELQEKLAEARESLAGSEAAYKEMLGARVKENFQTNPEMTAAKALKEIIIPGLTTLNEEKLNSLPPKDQNLFQKGLQIAGKYLPKSKLGRTLTVAGIIALGSVALGPGATGGLALYLGAKIGRSLAGSYVGEKASEIVERQMDKHSEKREAKNLEKVNFSPEDINTSVDKLMTLGEENLKSRETQEKLKKYAKLGTHIITAGATMAGLELVHAGIEVAAASGAEIGATHVAETSANTLAAETFIESGQHAGLDLAGEKIAHRAHGLHRRAQTTMA